MYSKVVLAGQAHVEHETLRSAETRMRHFFRCFDPERQNEARNDPTIAAYLESIRTKAESMLMEWGRFLIGRPFRLIKTWCSRLTRHKQVGDATK